jgi:Type VI secretion system/phage-baseplate injector OB domain
MASNQIRTTGMQSSAKADGKSGYIVDPGPYEAIVTAHVLGTRAGQLKVWIPDWGGMRLDPDSQIVVNYASPFYGTTYGTDSSLYNSTSPNAQYTSGQSYGMWFVPPDVGNKVLVVFVAGDRNRGYWFGCVYDSTSHHMVPGLSRNIGGSANTLPPNPGNDISSAIQNTGSIPVTESYPEDSREFSPEGITKNPRYLHEYQTRILIKQGLDQDLIRGAISSSSLREAPSNVYGISTPGRPITKDGTQVKNAFGVDAGQAVVSRSGGHSFVMDDGDASGTDQLVRLRTTQGHQILMNDTAGVLYIASASGKQWLEFSSDGSINIYSDQSLNVRAAGTINMYSGTNINMDTPGTVHIKGGQGVVLDSPADVKINALNSCSVVTDGSLTLSARGAATLVTQGQLLLTADSTTSVSGSRINLNGGAKGSIAPKLEFSTNSLPDVLWNGKNWKLEAGKLPNGSICTVVPAHEPWIDPDSGQRPN